eukprot:Gb_31193 [translate_table: standard]
MKLTRALEIFCICPASTAIYLCLERRSTQTQYSRLSEHTRLLDRQNSEVLEDPTWDLKSIGNAQHKTIEEQITPALQQKPKEVVLRVSLHCPGCAKKVRKHISKMEGVTSFAIDLEEKKVTVAGNISPIGVLESISKVKNAEFWPNSNRLLDFCKQSV